MTRICFALLLFLPGLPGCGPAGPPPFRTIPDDVAKLLRVDCESTVITSKMDLDFFLERIHRGSGDGGRGFRAGLHMANLDFAREALVILKHVEGSVSTRVTFETPVLNSGRVICRITRKEQNMGLTQVGYYRYIIAVDKSAVDAVELRVEGRKTVVLPVSAAK